MSTGLAVAATTRVIGALIDSAVAAADIAGVLGAPPYFTSQAPDQIEVGAGEKAQLGLFLYHVTHNPGWREVGLPSRNGAGAAVDRPPLAVDLHYLLIAYGAQDLTAQMLLGLGLQALHETPLLYRQQITDAFTPPPALSATDAALATAGLDRQVELIKITPEPLSADDLSKLWTAFGSKFRPSSGFVATTVLIESNRPVSSPPPVATRDLTVLQLRTPAVDAVVPAQLAWSASPNLTLSGTDLTGENVVVVFDNNPGAPQAPQRTGPSSASVGVPALPAGINTLRVVQQLDVGAVPAKNVVESNVSVFYLRPLIRLGGGPNSDLIQVGATDNTVDPPITPVTVQLDPVLSATQTVQLMLNELAPPAGHPPLSLTFAARPDQIGPHYVTFDISGARAGDYLVRIRVDGAESELRTDPVTHAYAHPTVTL